MSADSDMKEYEEAGRLVDRMRSRAKRTVPNMSDDDFDRIARAFADEFLNALRTPTSEGVSARREAVNQGQDEVERMIRRESVPVAILEGIVSDLDRSK